MAEPVKAWQCIGCGKIEAPQTCVGVCQDRKVELVYADEHRAELAALQSANDAMAALLKQFAYILPREGGWENSYRAMQERAKQVLANAGA
jgi:hypothetical protein